MSKSPLDFTDHFVDRHVGPSDEDSKAMLKELGASSMDSFIDSIVPKRIRLSKDLDLGPSASEHEALVAIRELADKNSVWRSYLGMGYNGTLTPPVIQRGVLENPGWYTQYTPYQAEISQGRLEALLNFQTMVIDLTGLPIANASLLDEATAAAEAMTMSFAVHKSKGGSSLDFFAASDCHPQTLAVLRTRAEPLGIKVVTGDASNFDFKKQVFGALIQYPATSGAIHDVAGFISRAQAAGALSIVAADILSLTLLKSPGELGADIAIGSTQRFGVPMGYGGPHAAYMSTKDEHKRLIPGRIIGLSQDSTGRPAARLALQTREQHIRREKATSNICTAQVLLAVISGMYAVYHGPEGLRRIASRVHTAARTLAAALEKLGHKIEHTEFFDTVTVKAKNADVAKLASSKKINLHSAGANTFTIALDETVSRRDLGDILECFNGGAKLGFDLDALAAKLASDTAIPSALQRKSSYLTHPVFNSHHSETELLRYMQKLQKKDLSLTTSMIALGSCTMKLNATAEMLPVTWPEFGAIHPFAPKEQTGGYQTLFRQLEGWLAEITGFAAVSLQPNAGSQGEYAGLLAIRKYHQSRREGHRNVCLIPRSAHGTNPASAVMAGMQVVVVDCDDHGNVSLSDLRSKAETHAKNLSCAMITYPSTHGVFEETITDFCDVIHKNGGLVYMDGANMNAQVGLCRPGDFGPDVCHLNLHKTFCIPHGGGGPGMGPIGVVQKLAAFLPSHPVVAVNPDAEGFAISAAPWGSASILPISWMYIKMMGTAGLKKATQVAILNANYMAKRLEPHFPVLYRGAKGFVAHECIIDLRKLKESSGVEVEDVAKRLMDYGFHAPTVSFPVPGTMMIEPTESEPREEMDRFCEAMIKIREEIKKVENGTWSRTDNPLKNAPHTAEQVLSSTWSHTYTREEAAFPAKWTHENKFWPPVSRVNGVLGDRNLICACPTTDSYS